MPKEDPAPSGSLEVLLGELLKSLRQRLPEEHDVWADEAPATALRRELLVEVVLLNSLVHRPGSAFSFSTCDPVRKEEEDASLFRKPNKWVNRVPPNNWGGT